MFIKDGYIVGTLSPHAKRCLRCGQYTRCIDIAEVTLPESFTAEATILWSREHEAQLEWIGLGCGCYAKFHRQVAHILGSQLKRGAAV